MVVVPPMEAPLTVEVQIMGVHHTVDPPMEAVQIMGAHHTVDLPMGAVHLMVAHHTADHLMGAILTMAAAHHMEVAPLMGALLMAVLPHTVAHQTEGVVHLMVARAPVETEKAH